mgnify:CR=1 FL=1|tara:strand:+ start:2260 stop:2727 length:468 start_codon:yes stop_codon:yes gene_type:complete
MEKSPLNFGFGGGMGVLNAVQPQMPWNNSQFGGNLASWVANQAQNQNQYGSAGSPQFQAQAQLDAAAATDPNNLSATGIGVPNTTYSSMDPLSPEASGVATTPTVTNDATGIGAVPTTVGTGSFSPQVQNVAQGVYGDQNMRDASVQKRKLINLI